MNRVQQTPLILQAITLRGIGSYVNGARLVIAPLTILCGKNGSGKSTWLKILKMLQSSLEKGVFPYGYDVSDWEPRDIRLTNAFYHIASPDDHTRFDSPETLADYGPPTTIGLEVVASKEYYLPICSEDSEYEQKWEGDFQKLFWTGVIPECTKIRIRTAHPTYFDDGVSTPSLKHLIELRVNDRYVVKLESERDPHQTFGPPRPRRREPYTLSCSKALVTGNDSDLDVIEIATFTRLNKPRFTQHHFSPEEIDPRALLFKFESWVKKFCKEVLSAYFGVGAIRAIHEEISVQETEGSSNGSNDNRYVGYQGEQAWQLQARHGSRTMRSPGELGEFTSDEIRTDILHGLTPANRAYDPRAAHIWNSLTPPDRDTLNQHLAKYDSNSHAYFGDASALKVDLARILNSLVKSRDFYESAMIQSALALWAPDKAIPDAPMDLEVDMKGPLHSDEELDLYGGPRPLQPSDAAIRRINYVSLLCVLNRNWYGIVSRSEYSLEEYVSHWMQLLSDSPLCFDGQHTPLPFLISDNARNDIDAAPVGLILDASKRTAIHPRHDLRCVIHSCFGVGSWGQNHKLVSPQPPRQMSSGFHQILPIIVQLGLMKAGEIIAIENPEVHLHPSLQLKLTEALIAHAKSGRRIIIETHSDLVVRRVLRAILEESISQSESQIYFSGLTEAASFTYHNRKLEENIKVPFYGSELEPIRIDNSGRVANWPEGFLDDDVRESQRLLDIMYGGVEADDDEEDDENDEE